MAAVIPLKEVEYEHPLPGNACDTRHAWARVPVEPSPAERTALKERIRRLLKERNAVMVSHYYVHPDLQDLAEETGGLVSDSLEMARFGRDHAAQTLVVSGVRFMGETAKILSPEKTVLMPDLDATCSLDLGCAVDEFSAFCDAHPDRTVVVYANTSAAVKALVDPDRPPDGVGAAIQREAGLSADALKRSSLIFPVEAYVRATCPGENRFGVVRRFTGDELEDARVTLQSCLN